MDDCAVACNLLSHYVTMATEGVKSMDASLRELEVRRAEGAAGAGPPVEPCSGASGCGQPPAALKEIACIRDIVKS